MLEMQLQRMSSLSLAATQSYMLYSLDRLGVDQWVYSLVLEEHTINGRRRPDGDVQNADGGVVVEPERFEVEGVDSVDGGAGGGDGMAQWCFPSLTAPSLDRVRVWTVGNCSGGKPRYLSL